MTATDTVRLAAGATTAPARRTVSERGLLALVLLGAAALAGLWWHDTTILTGTGEWLTAAGRVTGLLGGYTVAVVLLLMSRAPWIDHGLGPDRLGRWHAMGGRYLLSLLVAHALLIIWGYSLTAHAGVLAETRLLVVAVPDVLLASIGLGLFVVVGVVSAGAVRRRVTYETWYLLHLLTYVAVGLSFLHVLSTGADFRSTAAKAAWIALYGGAAAALLWYRWLGPVRLALRHDFRVSAVEPEAPGVVTITVTGRDVDRLVVAPGQFFRWRFLTSTGWWQSHPYSLSAMPAGNDLRLTVKDLGDHSRDVQALLPGTRVLAEGPYGAFTPARRRGRGVLLLAGGIGITPLRTMLECLGSDVGPVTLLYRVNDESEVIFGTELAQLAEADHVTLRYVVGPPGGDGDVLVGTRLSRAVPDLARRDAFVCGPPRFMDAAGAALLRCGMPGDHIHLEQFSF